jgi:hypothetical protein
MERPTKLAVLATYVIACMLANNHSSASALPAQAAANPDVDHIVSEFTIGEAEYQAAFDHYGYKQDLVLETLQNGKVTGEFHRITQIGLNKDGKPEERIISFPASSLKEVAVTREDLDDLSAKYQFTLQPGNASKYKFHYAGRERIDAVDLYLFDVKPKVSSAKERLFKGRIWVSDSNLRIFKMRGRGERKGNNQAFPVMEVQRTLVDGSMFPAYAFADEKLVFQNGSSVHLRIHLRFTDYVKLR